MSEEHHEMMTAYLLNFRLNIILDRWLITSVLYVMLEIDILSIPNNDQTTLIKKHSSRFDKRSPVFIDSYMIICH